MSNTLQIKRRTSAGVPSGLAAGELAVNLSDNKLYVGNAAANGVIHLNPSASTSYLPLAGGDLTGTLNIGNTGDEKIVLKNSNNPYVMFQQGTTNKGFIQWNAAYAFLEIANSAESTNLRLDDTLQLSLDGGSYYDVLTSNTGLLKTGGTLTGNLGINTGSSTPAQKLHIKDGGILMTDENAGQSMFRARNFAASATGSFNNTYGFEYRHATSGGVNHAALIHCHENNSARKILTVSSAFGTVAEFASNGTCTLASPTITGNIVLSSGILYAGSPYITSSAIAQFNGFLRFGFALTHDATRGLYPHVSGQGSIGMDSQRYGKGFFNRLDIGAANAGEQTSFGDLVVKQQGDANTDGFAVVGTSNSGNSSLRLWVDSGGNRKINAGTTEVFSFTTSAISLLQPTTFSGNVTLNSNLTVGGRLTVSDTSGADGLVIAGGENTGMSARLFFETGTGGQGISILNVGGSFQFRTGATAGSSSGVNRLHISTGGTLYPEANDTTLGLTTKRWQLRATSGDFSGNLLVGSSSTANTTIRINNSLTAGSDTAVFSFGLNNSSFDFAGMRLDYSDRETKGLELFTAALYNYPITISPCTNKDIALNTSGTGKVTTTGDLTVGGSLYLTDTNTRLHEGDNNSLRITTNSGYVETGCQNTSFAHFYTDRNQFYFNKQLNCNGHVFSSSNNSHYSGLTTNRWANVYSVAGDFSGNLTVGGTMSLGSSQKLQWGDAATYITGSNSGDFLQFYPDGNVQLTLNSSGATIEDSLTVGGTTSTFGTNGSIILKDPYAANDAALEIKRDAGANSSILLHGEGDSYIANGITGGLVVGSASPSGFKFQVAGTAKVTSDLTVGGTATVTSWLYPNNGLSIPDSKKILLGNQSDLEIYHDGSDNHSYIKESGSGHLYIQATNLRLQSAAGGNILEGVAGGVVRLYHNDVKKFETTSTGASVTGDLNAVPASPTTAAHYLRLKHDNTEGVIDANRGNLKLQANDYVYTTNNFGIGTASPAAKLDIYHNGGFTNDVPTARIYHRNLPDSGNNRVAALDVNVGMNNGDLFHHGHVQLFQHFTGGAYNSPRLYFSSNSWTTTNHRQWWGIQALADTTATGDRLAFTCDLSSTNPTATPVHIMSLLTNGRVGIGETSPWSGLHLKSQTLSGWNGLIYNAVIASSNTYANGHAGGILFAGAYNSSETQTGIAGVWASRPNAGNGQHGGMVHIGGRQHDTSNIPKVLNVNHEAVGIGTTSPAQTSRLHVQGTTSIVHIESSTADANASVWFKSNVSGTVANRWEIGTNISRGASLEIFDRLNSVSRLELTNGGNLGLGTESSGPSAKLHINETSTGTPLQITRASNSGNGMIKFETGSTDDWILGLRNTGSNSDFRLYSYGTSSDVLTITRSNGNVDINNRLGVGGAHSGSYGLYVHGTSYFGGKLTTNDSEVAIISSGGYTTHLNYNDTGSHYISMGNSGFTVFRGSSNGITAMRVNGNGEVSINSGSSGGYNLNVNGTSYLGGNSVLNGILYFGSTSGSFINTDSSSLRLAGDNGVKLQTYSGGWQDRLVIADDGDIDIAQRLGVGGAHSGSYGLYVHGTSYFNSTINVDGNIHLDSMGDYITFYGDGGSRHAISSRNSSGNAADDLRINTYGALFVNLDSNGDNSSGADFSIGRHGEAGSISDWLLDLSGETGQLQLSKYGGSGLTGTVAKYLAVDSSGNVIQDDLDWEDMPNISSLTALP